MATCSSAHSLFPPDGARQTIACVVVYPGDAIMQVGTGQSDRQIFKETQGEHSMTAQHSHAFLDSIPNASKRKSSPLWMSPYACGPGPVVQYLELDWEAAELVPS